MSSRGRPRGNARVTTLRGGKSPTSRAGSPSTRSGSKKLSSGRGGAKRGGGGPSPSLRGNSKMGIKTSGSNSIKDSVKRRNSENSEVKRKIRRPKFSDNPSAPEIVEKISSRTSRELENGLEEDIECDSLNGALSRKRKIEVESPKFKNTKDETNNDNNDDEEENEEEKEKNDNTQTLTNERLPKAKMRKYSFEDSATTNTTTTGPSSFSSFSPSSSNENEGISEYEENNEIEENSFLKSFRKNFEAVNGAKHHHHHSSSFLLSDLKAKLDKSLRKEDKKQLGANMSGIKDILENYLSSFEEKEYLMTQIVNYLASVSSSPKSKGRTSSSAAAPTSVPSFDKNKLFSQMEDKFAKDTRHHHVFKRSKVTRGSSEDIKNEEVIISSTPNENHSASKILIVREPLEQGAEDKENNFHSSSPSLYSHFRYPFDDSEKDDIIKRHSDPAPLDLPPSPNQIQPHVEPPILSSEIGFKPLEIDIPGGSLESLSPEETKGEKSFLLLRSEGVSVSPTILSRHDAETAAEAVLLRIPSLKTVIKIPSKESKKKKRRRKKCEVKKNYSIPLSLEEEIEEDMKENSILMQHSEDPSSPSHSRQHSRQENNHSQDEDEDEENEMTNDEENEFVKNSLGSEEEKSSVSPESMVVPEKASSFKIHPGRCCYDTCHYCGLKFGMLDTPMHVSQLKTTEIRKFAEDFTGFEKDACLCDKCYRYLDRRARSKGGEDEKKKREDSLKEDRVRACLVRNCNREVSNSISKKWLIRLKKKLIKKLSLDWDRVTKASVKASFPVCTKHNSWVEYYSLCGLCKRKLSLGAICTLGMTKSEVIELNGLLRGDRIPAELLENNFVCKLCRMFCSIKVKASDQNYLKTHKSHKGFYKDYKKRLYIHLGLEVEESEDNSQRSSGDGKTPKKIHQVSQSDNPTKITIKTTTLENNSRKKPRRPKEFPSPSSESRLHVTDNGGNSRLFHDLETKASVTIQFDLNTKKLWHDMHFPYGNYTAFFRHLILLEKYWRNGDLVLGDTAAQKASLYLKSVGNRIKTFEGRHKRSEVDLSASTRPDLSEPPLPMSFSVDVEEQSDDSSGKSSSRKKDNDVILKIPKIPMPPPQSTTSSSPPPLPTKIRVRTDLMHLGLMATKPVPNLMESLSSATTISTTTTTTTKKLSPHTISSMLNSSASGSLATSTPPSSGTLSTPPGSLPPGKSSSNLIKLLSESSGSSKQSSASSANSQLFKEPSSSSAIPLTFNNSIAEVLAAAAAKTKEPGIPVSSCISSKITEITVTMSPNGKWPTSQDIALIKAKSSSTESSSSQRDGTRSPLTMMMNMDRGAIGSVQTSGSSSHVSHFVSGHGGGGTKSRNKASLPPSPLQPPPPQMQHQQQQQQQQQQKKNINNILDRLSGLKSTSASVVTSKSSSLAQQLAAPPIMTPVSSTHPHLPNVVSSARSTSSKQQHTKQSSSSSAVAAAAAAANQLNELMLLNAAFNTSSSTSSVPSNSSSGGGGGGLLTSPLVSYPDWNDMQTLLMAGGIPGLNQVQAAQRAQALRELMNLSLTHSKGPLVGPAPTTTTTPPRIRAPPPLTHMGKSNNSNSSNNNNNNNNNTGATVHKPKNDE